MAIHERLRGFGKDATERLFYTCVQEMNIDIVYEPPGIIAPYFVKDKRGRVKKIKTVPDYLVTHPDLGLSTYVEVTRGAGKSPSKLAQLRVVEAAGVENYVQLTGYDVQKLSEVDVYLRRILLFQLLGWASPSMR